MSRKMIDYKVEDGTITSIDGYEVGGGGRYNAQVTLTKCDTWGNGGSYVPNWTGIAPRPNTAYEVGQRFCLFNQYSWDGIKVEPNQIFIPITVTNAVSSANQTLQFGEVTLILDHVDTTVNMSVRDGKYIVGSRNYAYYTVIKAGTTGDTITLPSGLGSSNLNYAIYTLGITKDTQ